MDKKIKVKHTHRYTQQKAILFEGSAFYQDNNEYLELRYQELDDIKVVMYCFLDYMIIERFGEVHSKLTLDPRNKTKNCMSSEYGIFEIELSTIAYQKKDYGIIVEYDIEGADREGFKIEIELQEERNEYN